MELAKTIAFSAVGGMVVGMVGCGGKTTVVTDTPAADSSAPAADPAAAAAEAGTKACCKGQNECAKKGSCKVEGVNTCKGQNECAKKGGCNAHCDNK